MSREERPGEIYLEFRPIGQQVKVTAIDAATGFEVSVFGPASAAQEDLKPYMRYEFRLQLSCRDSSKSSDFRMSDPLKAGFP